MAMVTKTIKLGVLQEIHAIKRRAITDTQELYNRVIRFYIYMEFFVAHLGIFEEKVPTTKKHGDPAERNWTAPERLTFAERHTLSTGAHPEPLMPLIGTIPQAEGMPTGLRRAAINHASGKVTGWHTRCKQWEHGGKKGRAPQMGEPNEPVTFYADMVDYPDFDVLPQATVQQVFIAVKLWYGGEWQKVPLPITLPRRDFEALRAAKAAGCKKMSEIMSISGTKSVISTIMRRGRWPAGSAISRYNTEHR